MDMENILFQQVAGKLVQAEKKCFTAIPASVMTSRASALIRRAEKAGFSLKGPFAATTSLPSLIAYGQCKGEAEYSKYIFSVELRCWVDGEVNLIVLHAGTHVFWARVYSDGRVAQESYFDKLPNSVVKMPTEELLTSVEAFVHAKHSQGIAGLISEVYMLTTLGDWLCKPYMVLNQTGSKENAEEVKKIIRSLKERRLLCGVVYVTGGQVVGAKQTVKREALIFNAHGPAGHRVRVYAVSQVAGRMQPSKLIGVFKD